MNPHTPRDGFSLMEVNMAVFVMAIGILSMVVLYPLGLRESTQGQADLKQAMFADCVLNQAVAAASQTNVTWSQWTAVPRYNAAQGRLANNLPSFIRTRMDVSGLYPNMAEDKQYRIGCCLLPGHSDRVMGIMVQSSELTKSITQYSQFSNNPIFYAEVQFQGDPTR